MVVTKYNLFGGVTYGAKSNTGEGSKGGESLLRVKARERMDRQWLYRIMCSTSEMPVCFKRFDIDMLHWTTALM